MTIEHDTTKHVDRELYDELRAEVSKLRDTVTGVRAVVNADEPADYLGDIYAATDALYAVLAIPQQRPGAWEAQHVQALWEPLCEILDALKAERPDRSDR